MASSRESNAHASRYRGTNVPYCLLPASFGRQPRYTPSERRITKIVCCNIGISVHGAGSNHASS